MRAAYFAFRFVGSGVRERDPREPAGARRYPNIPDSIQSDPSRSIFWQTGSGRWRMEPEAQTNVDLVALLDQVEL
jgi:hypothetical protein